MKKNLTDGLPIVLRQCCQRSSSLLVLLQREHLVLQPLVLGIQGRHTLLQGDPLVLHRGLHLEKGLTEGRGGYGGVGSRRQNSFNDKKNQTSSHSEINFYFSPILILSLLGAWAFVSRFDGGVGAQRRPHDGLKSCSLQGLRLLPKASHLLEVPPSLPERRDHSLQHGAALVLCNDKTRACVCVCIK